ncbi:penicillin-binding protein 1A [Shewanella litorisediminis]|uniref:Penicillin-binding protein 1A n=1 Tax=Shewanella litorisediminis TaxID=1173586 RepID=A0ABX7G2L9_9GAMM|nr:PBP1A family penicillin-binding protein [Shewanella litorisediminis]MCL2917108.1 PBP1A family penicillin-binding protein [Shewanella litorisediminis]QRH01584.1 PBP1A family penicillin-binding protein [Shewanella litorisediminis]
MKWLKRILIALFSLALLGVGAIVAAYFYVLPDLPDVTTLKTVQLQTPLKIYSQDGKLISQYGEKRRIPMKLEDVPKPLLQAFLATEDARFYEHQGIDPIGIIRAAFVLAATGEKKQGASTITQQVARNFFLTRDKTIIRKVKEIFISFHIEELLTKDEILELYVNRIYLGQRAYGVGAAAQVYYGKDLKDLSLAEMAVIAGLPKAPSTLNPISSPERALNRRNIVLMRMREVGYINDSEYQLAISQPNTASYHGAEIDLYVPYVSEMARDYMIQKYGEEEAYTGGYSVYTTVNSDLQLKAQKALRNNIYAYDERHGYRGAAEVLWKDEAPATDTLVSALKKVASVQELEPAAVINVQEQQATVLRNNGETVTLPWQGIQWARKFISDTRQGAAPKAATDVLTAGERIWIRHNGEDWQLSQVPEVSSAIVSLDPHNGAIRALVGGYSFSQSQFNRVTQAKRQLGSNIKPFIYAATLEKGYTLATLINNAPINKPDLSQGTAWRPKNSPDTYTGPTRLRVGLAQSINVMAVRALRYSGIDATVELLTRFGFDPNDLPRNESLALGSPSVTPLQVVRAFSAFANGGYLVEPFFIDRVESATGNLVEKTQPTLACEAPAQDEIAGGTNAAEASAPPAMLDASVQTEASPQCGDPAARYANRVISEQNAFLITEALKSVIWGGGDFSKGTGWNGTAWRAARLLKRHDIAGKTGTTNESRDTWFSGFNPDLVTTVWVGFDDHGRELGRTAWNANGAKDQISGAEAGAKTAGPAWNEFMFMALADTPEKAMPVPAGIVSARIDYNSGKLSRRTDHTSGFEYFAAGTVPTDYANSATTEDDNTAPETTADDLFQ